MAAPKTPALTHRMRPPDVGRAAGHAAANDQNIAVHDFGFRPIHRVPQKFALVGISSGAGRRWSIHAEILGFAEQRGGLAIETVRPGVVGIRLDRPPGRGPDRQLAALDPAVPVICRPNNGRAPPARA